MRSRETAAQGPGRQPTDRRPRGRPAGALWVAMMLILGSGGAAAQSAFTNPVLSRPYGVADPFLLKWNGEYYLYATGNPLRAYHSVDLVEWEEIGPVLSGSTEPEAWNQTDVWAPEVIYRNGTFYLYYTASRASDDWRVSEEARRIGVATSSSPRGPFVDSGSPVTPGWGIDGHVFRDPDTGRDYLFYSYLYEPELPGAGLVVDSLVTPHRTGGLPAHVTRGSEAWEDKDGDPGNGSLRYTNEAPTVLARDGLYYMLYSGGSWDLTTYALGYAVSDEVMPAGGLTGPGWTKVVPPILRANDLVQGPGHNSVARAPNNVHDITAYHGRSVPFRSPGDRQTFLDRLYWNHDRPFLDPPTLGARAAPDRPVFEDRFDGSAGSFGDGWERIEGSWAVADGELEGTGRTLVRADPLRHYVFEANVRMPGSRGEAGVIAWHRDPDNRVEAWLDPANRRLVIGGVIDGREIPVVATPLDPQFRFDAYHQLLVTRNGARLELELDGVRLQRLELPPEAGRPGLMGRGARARFDGVALTSHYRDAFGEPDVDWETRGGAWLVDEGALHQVAGGPETNVALKGDPARDYEFTASLRWRDNLSVQSRAGVAAAADAHGSMVIAGFDNTIWPYARFHVRHVRDGVGVDSLAVEMPRGFLYDAYHTIRVVKQGHDFTFYLDGREIAAARFPLDEAVPGLYTEGARAAFDNVSMTRIVTPRNRVLNGSFEAERWEQGQGATRAPWRLSGGADVVECCAYEGTRRLLLSGPDARAEQTIEGLEPGAYRLRAWSIARDAEPVIRVEPGGAPPRETPAIGGAWRRLELEFEVPPGRERVVVSVGGRFSGGADAYVAVDNLYLVRR